MKIHLDNRQLCDLEMLMIGAFDPVFEFMGQDDYNSVLNNMCLVSGEIFPLPIVLDVGGEVPIGEIIEMYDNNHFLVANMTVTESWKVDLELECEKSLGTIDSNHPYVPIIMSRSGWYVSGKPVGCGVQHYDFLDLRTTPLQMRNYFSGKGRVVGFQTRNPMHRSHYELVRIAITDLDAIGFIQPVVGITQDCDVEYHRRVRCYKAIMSEFTEYKAELGLLPLSMRMAGPKEAVLHAIIRRNYGCTHFIVGRDHAGPSYKTQTGDTFYNPSAAAELCLQLNLGIEIVTFPNVVYVEEIGKYIKITDVPAGTSIKELSGTELRQRLTQNMEIPSWFSFPKVVELLREKQQGICVYIVGLSASGKSTLATCLREALMEITDRPITLLDGDEIRENISKGLGFSKQDRSTNVRRIGYVAYQIVKHGGICLVANIAPYNDDRQYNRKLISTVGNYFEVYIGTPLHQCEQRDPKGLYKLAREGKIKQFTGIDDPFEEPNNSEIMLTGSEPLHDVIKMLVNKLYRICIKKSIINK